MLRKTSDKDMYWNSPMTRKDWAVLYGASFLIGTVVSLATVWPIIGDSIKGDVEDLIDAVKEKLHPRDRQPATDAPRTFEFKEPVERDY